MSGAAFFGFFIMVAVCSGQQEKCGVFPTDPVIRMGSDIEIMFRGPHHNLCNNVTSYSPHKITWRLNYKTIDDGLYAVINSTIAAVSIRNFTLPSGIVTCHMDIDGQDVILGATTIRAFSVPPAKPTNISCVTILEESFTCYWDSGHDTQLPTDYTVFREGNFWKDNCTSKSSPCTFHADLLALLKISVRAENAFGVARSDVVELNSMETVKLRPPKHVHVTPYLDRLLVKWDRPADTENFNVICQVLYRYQRHDAWTEHVESIKMGSVNPEGVADIKVEHPCIGYSVSVRCKFEEALWSDWSQSISVVSSLDVNNIKFHLWRKIFTSDVKGQRRVLLMWKGVPSSCSFIDGYRITVMNSKSACPMDHCTMVLNTSSSQLNLTLDAEEYTITIAAYENISTFSEDSITVPAVGEECPPLKEVETVASDNQITVNWTASSRPAVRYMIDWSTDSDDIRWHDSETTHFALKGEPQKLYRIAVTPLYENCTGQETALLAYSEEGVPGDVASVEVSDVRESSACISWTPVPQNKCCSFVRNYTVFYAPHNGTAMDVTVNSGVHEVCLNHLQHSTIYTISVMAMSNGGYSWNNSTTFRTSSNGRSFPRILIGGLCLIFFIVVGTLCFFMVNKYVMKVPSPQFSTLVPWPEQLYQKDKNVSKLLIPECLDNIAHSLVILPISFDLDIDENSSTAGEDYCAEPPGSVTKESNNSTEVRITTLPPADLLGIHESPIATAARVIAGEVPHDQGLGNQKSIDSYCQSPVGRKECLSKDRSPEKDDARQPFLESQGNVPQAYVTMDLFG